MLSGHRDSGVYFGVLRRGVERLAAVGQASAKESAELPLDVPETE